MINLLQPKGKLANAVTLLTYIREVFSSNLGRRPTVRRCSWFSLASECENLLRVIVLTLSLWNMYVWLLIGDLLETGYVPEELNTAIVAHFFKREKNCENCKEISLIFLCIIYIHIRCIIYIYMLKWNMNCSQNCLSIYIKM
jgi:hypothetical protein